MIRNAYFYDSTFPVRRNIGFIFQVFAGVLKISIVVDLAKVKLINQVILNCAALQNADEEVSGSLHAEEVSGNRSDASRASGSGPGPTGPASQSGRKHGHSGIRLIGRHQARGRFVSFGNQKGNHGPQQEPKARETKKEEALVPQHPQFSDSSIIRKRKLGGI
ncbi:MAG TPA: hypothetical protein VK709_03825 [Candidatus Saccharimonadales bacterium]|nr:hypothetical protein [Candidatus Saccharimonadales bacterium]